MVAIISNSNPGPDVFISGVGQTEYVRTSNGSVGGLASRAIMAAAQDAAIDVRDIDGIVSYPGHLDAETVISTFGLPDVSFRASTTIGGASAVSGLGLAALAVRAGEARHVLLLRATRAGTGKRKEKGADELPNGEIRRQLEWPIGWNSAAQRYGMLCRRFMHEHGLTREHLAEIALAARAHANLNPAAQLYAEPLTREQYFGGGVVADPFWRYDCCLRTDGACAAIVSATTANGLPAVRVLAAAEGHPAVPDDLTSRPNVLDTGLAKASRRVWDRSGLSPDDIDFAMIYDCFTFEVAHQLAAAGFATDDGVGDVIASGAIRLGGKLPVNPNGGMLAEANMSGLSHVVEGVRQLRGEGGDRQVLGATRAVVTGWGNLGDGAIAVLGGDGA